MPVVCTLALTGCAAEGPQASTSAADCTSQVRLDGAVYTGFGHTARPIARLGTADLADCDDVGRDPVGSVFPEDPQQVAVWSVRGHPADQVLAVRWGQRYVEVFVADSLSGPDRDRLLRRLRREAP